MPLPPIMPGEPLVEREPLTEAQKFAKLQEIDLAIDRARERRIAYRAKGADRDVEIQDAIIDRRLRERLEVTGR